MNKQLAGLIIVISSLVLPCFSQNNKYGVFVGVGKYPEETGLESIYSSGNDAKGVCEAFYPGCKDGNSLLLIDEKATRSNILNGILSYQKKAVKGDLFVFYYSGHGTQFPDRLSEELDEKLTTRILQKNRKPEKFDSALVPFDSTKSSSGKLWRNLILDDELYRVFSGFTANGVKVVFISDSCYSGGQAKGLELFNQTVVQKEGKLGRAKYFDWKKAIGIKSESELDKGILEQHEFKPHPSLGLYILIASSQENEPSFSQNLETGRDMSLFTYYFLEVFRAYKNSNKIFTFETVQNVVSPKVQADAKTSNESQTPRIDKNFYEGSLNVAVF